MNAYADVFRANLICNIPSDLLDRMESVHSVGYLSNAKSFTWQKQLTDSAKEFLRSMGLNVFSIAIVENVYQNQNKTGIHPHGMNYYSLIRFINENTSLLN